MHKGQIYSMDFLAGAAIIIICLGLLNVVAEINFYNQKQEQGLLIMKQRGETALIMLTNSPQYDCNIGGMELAYSLSKDKIEAIAGTPAVASAKLKKNLGLEDYNVSISASGVTNPQFTKLPNNPTSEGKNIVTLDSNIALCQGNPTYSDFNACMGGGGCTNIKLSTLTLKVSK